MIHLTGQLKEHINGPTTMVRWSPSKTRISCCMIIVKSSNVLIWPLHALICNFSVIRITNIWMQQQFQFVFKYPGLVFENKTGFG